MGFLSPDRRLNLVNFVKINPEPHGKITNPLQAIMSGTISNRVTSTNPKSEMRNSGMTTRASRLSCMKALFKVQPQSRKLCIIAACDLLKQHQLIKPWPIKLKTDAGDKDITGLFQIDEAALNLLSAEALLEIRNSGGLLLAYCQLLSMQHLSFLGQLAEAHAKADKAAAEAANNIVQNGELNIEFLKKNETLSFTGF